MLRDVDGDGKADSSVHFGDYDNEGSLANCMRIHNGYLYFASELVVYRMQLTPGKMVPEGKLDTVFTEEDSEVHIGILPKPLAWGR